MQPLGEQVLAEGVERGELAGQDPGLDEALGHQHDLGNQLNLKEERILVSVLVSQLNRKKKIPKAHLVLVNHN